MNLVKLKDSSYSTQIYMGSNYVPINVIIDISTDWLAIKSKDCQTCTGKTYDTR